VGKRTTNLTLADTSQLVLASGQSAARSGRAASDEGINVDTHAVTGFGIAILLRVGGTVLVIRHNRRGMLAPA